MSHVTCPTSNAHARHLPPCRFSWQTTASPGILSKGALCKRALPHLSGHHVMGRGPQVHGACVGNPSTTCSPRETSRRSQPRSNSNSSRTGRALPVAHSPAAREAVACGRWKQIAWSVPCFATAATGARPPSQLETGERTPTTEAT